VTLSTRHAALCFQARRSAARPLRPAYAAGSSVSTGSPSSRSLADWLPTLRAGGYVLDPVGPGRAAPIDPADIAAVAAVTLTDDGHEGEEYLLTGGETFTVAEQLQVLAKATGRDIEVRAVATPVEAVRFRYPHGAPQALADALIEGLTLMRADIVGVRTDTVQRLLGRAPRTFADWCARNAAAFPGPAAP
jgi:uncharacterized protein YbjT (DUF2867 family)